MAREMPRPPPRGRGGDVVNLRCGSGARGAAVASGRTPARGGETARAAATRAPSAPRGLRQSVAVFFFVLFGFFCWSGRRGDRGIHRAQARSVFGDNALASRHSRQPYVHLNHVRRTPLRTVELLHRGGQGGPCCLPVLGLRRENCRGRHAAEGGVGGSLLPSGTMSPKGSATKRRFLVSYQRDVGNEATRSTTVQDAKYPSVPPRGVDQKKRNKSRIFR